MHKGADAYASRMTFGARLAQARNAKKLTQTEVGKGLGTDGVDVGKSVVYGWERKNHYPRADQLALICQKLKCSADWLLTGIPTDWPFSLELRQRVDQMDEVAQRKLENVMRAHLDMQPLPALTQPEPQSTDADAYARASQPFASPPSEEGSEKSA